MASDDPSSRRRLLTDSAPRRRLAAGVGAGVETVARLRSEALGLLGVDARPPNEEGIDAASRRIRTPHRTYEHLDLRAFDPERESIHPVAREITADLRERFADAEDADLVERPDPAFLGRRFFDFRHLDAWEVVGWEWVRPPYAYVSVLRDPDRNKRRYHVSEPLLDEFEYYVWRDLLQTVRNQLLYEDIEAGADSEAVFDGRVREIIRNHAATVAEAGSLQKLYYYLRRDFVDMGPIDPLMRDADIEDISCDGPDVPVYIHHFEHRDLASNVVFETEEDLTRYVLRLANRSGEQISVSNPLVDGSLPDGSRIQLSFGGAISTRGPNFTVRRFADVPYTPVHLVEWGTFSIEQMAYFWLAIENNRSLVFTGGTGSGKTTSMNAVSFFIPGDSKIVSIEDTRELTLSQENWIQHLTRSAVDQGGRGEIGMYDLLQSALRQRPEYLLVGEIRTDERVAFTFFQAIGTGHTAYTTLHADSLEGVLNRLGNEPLNIPNQMILDLDIISIQRQVHEEDRRVRRNQQVTELIPGDAPDAINAIDVFEHDPETDRFDRLADSRVLAEVADEHGWSRGELREELRQREAVLEYLVENGIRDYDAVTSTIRAFDENRPFVLGKVREGELTPADVLEGAAGDGTTSGSGPDIIDGGDTT
jgi:flagellar protein FlaI